MYVWGCDDSIIMNNVIQNNNYEGIYFEETYGCIIANNLIQDNGGDGIYIEEYSGYLLVFENIFISNAGYGINIDGSVYNTIYHNYFISNGPSSSQGMDTGSSNLWYNASLNEGNYWDDYSGTGNYFIDGSANSADLYPLAISLSLEYSATVIIEVGSTGNTINWTVISTIPLTVKTPVEYIVYHDGSEVATGSFVDSSYLNYSIDGLALGVNNLTIVATDVANNTVTSTVLITVLDTIVPIIDSPIDITYPFGDAGNSISWTASDTNPFNYLIYREGVEVQGGSWVSGTAIIIDVGGLPVGEYNYTIVVTDGSGNEAIDTVFVTVDEAIIVSEFSYGSLVLLIGLVVPVVIIRKKKVMIKL
jgi:parallel beta-helix repeat protein